MARKPAKPSPASDSEAAFKEELHKRHIALAERFYVRLSACMEAAISKWEKQVLEDPNYKPTPSDIVGMMRTLREAEETIAMHSTLSDLLAKAKAEIKRLEDSMFNLLAGGPGPG